VRELAICDRMVELAGQRCVVSNPPCGVRIGDEAQYAPAWQTFKSGGACAGTSSRIR
jgi:23S rRNA G2445 N2-methylase RlmL